MLLPLNSRRGNTISVSHGVLSRVPRNAIDCRWVIKWKFVQDDGGQMVRNIRARPIVRAFNDRDAEFLSTYAATSTRRSQRLVCSTAATRRWPLVSVDVGKVVLQGMTYQDLSQLTGEPIRDVSFSLPTGSIRTLRTLCGYADFDPLKEVSHCDKPGTGLKDAPQAFSFKLKVDNTTGVRLTRHNFRFRTRVFTPERTPRATRCYSC